ncbi:NADH-quinone oxidoreductase subunit N [Francisella tularensis subsp. novicida]|uniref:NADH-quinone oxidoreductase subunit N n=3 Tax=Pseudomonadota TaxID=1224 RepID=A0A6I4RYH1_FRATU|nr:NADH-quinone oxidoreductase subunit N [Francisella tularensis]ABK90524.1 NADH dehydrogenase I, N subunit [Francisella tularensis subsp. novicida U112]AEE88093.1 NADH-ubiquinone oxidoreductase chain N [Francisella cf. novicida Fx1]AJI60459.1 proton-translocating NADH-quinone oxidoreductase, chain N family protein [Francisella tularensis subsp. novicida U112]APC94568.1 proton-translocating NADH-quinone oxidoreductase, chain N family protein [Francisella tularensis subsp. novicida]EDX18962.1 p
MSLSILYILPEILLALGVIVVMFSGLFLHGKIRNINYIFFQVFTLLALIATFAKEYLIQTTGSVFEGQVVFSGFAYTLQLVILVLAVFVALYSRDYVKDRKISDGDFYTLLMLCVLGAMVLTAAHSLVTIYVGLELLSLPMYALIAIYRDSGKGLEAAIKYFVLGAIASALLLFGMSFVYGMTGKLDITEIANVLAQGNFAGLQQQFLLVCLVMMIATFLFKLGAFPFHMWLPDVYQGAPNAVANIVATIPKVAAFAMLVNILFVGFPSLKDSWIYLFRIIGILSIFFGSLVALSQTNVKRLLGYSTVSQIGFVLLATTLNPQGYALTAASFYVIVYVFTTLAVFGVLTTISVGGYEVQDLNDLKGFNTKDSWLAFILLIVLFSMAGIPPFGGFIAKLFVVMGLINDGNYFLACFVLFMAVIASFYYVRVIKTMYFDDPDNDETVKPPLTSLIALSINGLVLLFLGIMPMLLLGVLTQVTNVI